MIYDLIAPIYDQVNGALDYEQWADFIESVFHRFLTKTPELVLDLGCGSGRMTHTLAMRGYDMIGADASYEMLQLARENAPKGKDILWLCQDMRSFELYGTVGAVVCCLDTVNHITSERELSGVFSLVHNYLDPDGLFVFDVNGQDKFEQVYADRTYVFETPGHFCIWENDYRKASRLCDFRITLFSENDDGGYERAEEFQREKMYPLSTLERLLKKAGLIPLGAFSDFSFTPAKGTEERIYLVARCHKPSLL